MGVSPMRSTGILPVRNAYAAAASCPSGAKTAMPPTRNTMTDITVSNTDWSVVDDVRAALAAARVGGSSVFESVTVATGDEELRENRLCASPVAVVHYMSTRERPGPEDVRGACVTLEIVLASAVDSSELDASLALAEILRLNNAAMNAVEASPPAAAGAWGSANAWQDRICWREPRIDTTQGRPWAVARLGLEVGYVVASGTEH